MLNRTREKNSSSPIPNQATKIHQIDSYYTVATNSNMLLDKPDDTRAKERATDLILEGSSVPFPEDLMNVFEKTLLQTCDDFMHTITSSGTYTVPTQPVTE
ncbi:hypothetical protein NPIL_692891 [Nephila pilipes]|uniref:Uncharacterized protein n=1 Tax=Nephila pilipes TaxID=299642 RepID=A0A8X6Q447_NEPPI|nr:hypothetical protein NPIL_692891 [Nephila pilipes]